MHRWILSVSLALAVVSGCYVGKNDTPSAGPATSTSPSSSKGADLPCEVGALLAESCNGCHGDPPTSDAPMSLVSLADLGAPSKSDASKSVAQVALERMKDQARPMPPTGLLSADRVAVFESWVTDGTPAGSCDGGIETPADTPTVCTSNKHWTRGDHGSESMHPGKACIDCHSSTDDAPTFRVAGTVFPTVHEPDDCNGATGSISVEITDANGKEHVLRVNSVGNFFSTEKITMPYTAKVVSGGKTRAMSAAQRTGDCNSCHTEQGTNDAPGRIMTP